MSHLCVVKNCSSQTKEAKKSDKTSISVYPFPQSKNLRKAWLDVIPFPAICSLKHDSRICEMHFKEGDFQPRFGQKAKKMLKKTAIPSIFPSNHETKFRCIAPNCKRLETGGHIPILKFPEDESLRRKWMTSIGKPPDTKPSPKSRICLNHFKFEDIMKFLMFDGVQTTIPSSRIVVKPNAVPTEFPGTNHNMYNFHKYNVSSICAVQDCKSHFNGHEVDLFPIPSNPELQATWSRVTPWRINWKFTPNMRICSEHFETIDFHRHARTERLKLKVNAIPSIFPNKQTSDADLVKIAVEIQIQKEMEENERRHLGNLVSNFDKLIENYRERINQQTLAKFRARISSTWITFYRIVFKDGVPEIKVTVNISDKMHISIHENNEKIHMKHFDSICENGKLFYYSQLENLLNAIASDIIQKPEVTFGGKENHDTLKKSLNDMIEECDQYDDDDSNELQMRLHAIYEQVSTATQARRHHSTDMIIEGAKILGKYPECYEIARKLTTYPPKQLQIYYMAKDDINPPFNTKNREGQKNRK